MKIITYTIFAIIAVLASSSRKNKNKSRTYDAASIKAACTIMCGDAEPHNYLNQNKTHASCACVKDKQITSFYGWDKETNSFVASKTSAEVVEEYIKNKQLVPY